MYFHWLTLQHFDRAKERFVLNHHFASALRNLLLNYPHYPLDNTNMLRLRKLERHYILFYSSF